MARTQERPPATAVAERPPPIGADGADGVPALQRRRRYAVRAIILPAVLVALVPVALFGLLYLQDQLGYVSTDNAVVTGSLFHLGPSSAGPVRAVAVDVGDEVSRDQVVATVSGASGQNVTLRSPVDGVVLARYANPGDVLASGKPVLTIANPGDFWIEARVEEGQFARVRPGQIADVTVDALGRTLRGRVASVGGASVGSMSSPSVGQGPTLRVRQLIPVRIEIEHDSQALVYGGLAFVRIHVRE